MRSRQSWCWMWVCMVVIATSSRGGESVEPASAIAPAPTWDGDMLRAQAPGTPGLPGPAPCLPPRPAPPASTGVAPRPVPSAPAPTGVPGAGQPAPTTGLPMGTPSPLGAPTDYAGTPYYGGAAANFPPGSFAE